jgi:hypothetical protein
MIFLPKISLYNLVEKELQKKQVIISDEKIVEKFFSLDILDSKVFFEGINIAKIDKLKLESLFLYTKIEFSNIVLIDSFTQFAPSPIENLIIKHTILNPNNILINANGNFGELSGTMNILNKELKIELNASNLMKSSYSKLLKFFKFENGRYIYEYRF